MTLKFTRFQISLFMFRIDEASPCVIQLSEVRRTKERTWETRFEPPPRNMTESLFLLDEQSHDSVPAPSGKGYMV